MVILLVGAEVLREVVDTLSENGDLHRGGTGVGSCERY
jgi:hypothetical protein